MKNPIKGAADAVGRSWDGAGNLDFWSPGMARTMLVPFVPVVAVAGAIGALFQKADAKKTVVVLALLLAGSIARAQQPEQPAPTMSMAEINAKLHAGDAFVEALTMRINIANFELRYMMCERSWKHTSWWKKHYEYHGGDPCKAVARKYGVPVK